VWVKICGITSVEDAIFAADAGADAIGLNFVPTSPRRVDEAGARAIAEAVRGRVVLVGVVADLDAGTMCALRERIGLELLQLHGSESPALLEAGLPYAYKAIRIGSREDVELADSFGGDRLLADSRVEGALGGTGASFDWRLVTELAARRPLILAGGLTADNVARAVQSVRPWGVDVASGVERSVREKDPDALRRFISGARAAER